MNRIYKVVWSKAKNCYTVVSEIAKRHGKGNRARTCAAAFLAAFALTGVMGMSEVQATVINVNNVTIDDSGNVATNSIQTNALNSKYNLSVGTANSNGTMPFFVNSNGAFYAANNKFSVDKDGKVTAAAGKIGQVTIDDKGYITGANYMQTNALNSKYNLSVGTANPNGTMPFFVNSNGAFYAANNKFSVDKDGKVTATAGEIGGVTINKGMISNGAARIALYGDSKVAGMVNGAGASIYMQAGNTIINSKVAIDKDGKITGVAAGAITADSTDAVNGSQLKQTNDNVASNTKAIGNLNTRVDGLDDRVTSNTAAINKNTEAIGNLNTRVDGLDNRVTDVENLAKKHTTVEAGNNITVTETTNTDGGKKYTVGMAKDITVDSVNVGGKTYVSEAGLNANGNKVTQVADGNIDKDSKDAVNGGQLYATNQLVKENASNISLLGNSINKLDNRVDKVGAGAAALAALHPLSFDPEDKWDFAAGYGNYSGASAVALGAYYRPNEDTMFSVGGSFGNGENMVNAGVSLKLGQSNHAPASKAAMEKKISALSQEVKELKAAIADLRAAQTKAKDATEKDAQKK